MNRITRFAAITVFSLALALAACSSPAATATSTIETPPTSTPAVPLVILLAAPESDANLASIAAEVGSAHAAANGMQFEQRATLAPAEIPPNLARLIILSPDPGAAAMVAAAPQAQVITIGFELESGPPNVVGIPVRSGNESQIAFIAGYIAAMSAEDWRTGLLYTGASAAIVNDFVAGAEYFCGSCAPFSPPFADYPVAAQAGDAQNWQSVADQLLAELVKVVYVAPELETSGAAQYLANSGVLIVAQGTPPAELASSWVVSIHSGSDASLRELLGQALSGQPLTAAPSLTLTNLNTGLFSESRKSNVQLVIDDLLNGFIQLPAD